MPAFWNQEISHINPHLWFLLTNPDLGHWAYLSTWYHLAGGQPCRHLFVKVGGKNQGLGQRGKSQRWWPGQPGPTLGCPPGCCMAAPQPIYRTLPGTFVKRLHHETCVHTSWFIKGNWRACREYTFCGRKVNGKKWSFFFVLGFVGEGTDNWYFMYILKLLYCSRVKSRQDLSTTITTMDLQSLNAQNTCKEKPILLAFALFTSVHSDSEPSILSFHHNHCFRGYEILSFLLACEPAKYF